MRHAVLRHREGLAAWLMMAPALLVQWCNMGASRRGWTHLAQPAPHLRRQPHTAVRLRASITGAVPRSGRASSVRRDSRVCGPFHPARVGLRPDHLPSSFTSDFVDEAWYAPRSDSLGDSNSRCLATLALHLQRPIRIRQSAVVRRPRHRPSPGWPIRAWPLPSWSGRRVENLLLRRPRGFCRSSQSFPAICTMPHASTAPQCGSGSGTSPCRSSNRRCCSRSCFRTMDAFRVFDLVFVMTQGGPGDATQVAAVLWLSNVIYGRPHRAWVCHLRGRVSHDPGAVVDVPPRHIGSNLLERKTFMNRRIHCSVGIFATVGLRVCCRFLWFVLTSFKSQTEIEAAPPAWWPSGSLDFYRSALFDHHLFDYVLNSVVVAGSTTLWPSPAIPAAYAWPDLHSRQTRHSGRAALRVDVPEMAIAGPVWRLLGDALADSATVGAWCCPTLR